LSAILLGNDVTVKDCSTEGDTFSNVPACTSTTETGCVVAYSSWNRTPPKDADFQEGRRVAKTADDSRTQNGHIRNDTRDAS
jgi:hypothetical protein